jgi:hypothetical protein
MYGNKVTFTLILDCDLVLLDFQRQGATEMVVKNPQYNGEFAYI